MFVVRIAQISLSLIFVSSRANLCVCARVTQKATCIRTLFLRFLEGSKYTISTWVFGMEGWAGTALAVRLSESENSTAQAVRRQYAALECRNAISSMHFLTFLFGLHISLRTVAYTCVLGSAQYDDYAVATGNGYPQKARDIARPMRDAMTSCHKRPHPTSEVVGA